MSRKYIARKLAGSSSPRLRSTVASASASSSSSSSSLASVGSPAVAGRQRGFARLALDRPRRPRPRRAPAAATSSLDLGQPGRPTSSAGNGSVSFAGIGGRPDARLDDARHATRHSLRRMDWTRSLRAASAVRRSRFPSQPCLCPARVHFSGFSIEPSPRSGVVSWPLRDIRTSLVKYSGFDRCTSRRLRCLIPLFGCRGREVRLEHGAAPPRRQGARRLTRQDADRLRPRHGALQRLGYVGVALLGDDQQAARDVPEELAPRVQAT